jgi:hypothetical protein
VAGHEGSIVIVGLNGLRLLRDPVVARRHHGVASFLRKLPFSLFWRSS